LTGAIILVLCSSTPCWAQDAKDKDDKEKDDAAELAVPVEAASRAQKNAAVKLYRQGLEHFEKEDYDKALEGFEASLAQVDSPNSRLMVARCLDKLGRLSDAYREFERVFLEATALSQAVKKYESTRDAAQAEMHQLEQRVAIVHLQTDGQVSVDGSEIANPERPKLVLPPGEVTLSLTLQNGEKAETKLTLAAGTEQTVALHVPKPSPPAPPADPGPPRVEYRKDPNTVDRSTLGYVGLGVAGAGAAGFVVFGLLDQSQFDKLDGQCSNGQCPASLESDAETGRFYQAAANVSLGLGAVGLATGLYFLLSGDSVSGSTQVEAKSEGTQVAVGPSELLVRGHF
jgi:tetratricopeptide (TPR) repeat protein